MGFASKLKALRNQHNITQKQISEIIGVTDRACRKYEAGDNEPTLSVLIALADYFNVPLDYLVGRDVDSGCPQPAVTPDEFALVEKLRALPPDKRKLAVDLLNQL